MSAALIVAGRADWLPAVLGARYSALVSTRLLKYRAFIQRLSLTNPATAIEQELYVLRPGMVVADEIAARLELNPTEALVLAGSVGVGKTTELMVASKRLSRVEDTHVLFVDVGKWHDLNQLEPGVLIAAVGMELCAWIDAASNRPTQPGRLRLSLGPTGRFRKWAMPRTEWIEDPDYSMRPDDEPDVPMVRVERPGRLSKLRSVSTELKEGIEAFDVVYKSRPSSVAHVLTFVDSLERVSDLEAFAAVVEQDVRLLQQLGVGVVLTAPLRSLYGTGRVTLEQRFEHILHLPPVNGDSAGYDFLLKVLMTRDAGAGLLSEKVGAVAAMWSGGVLRDLLGLARSAAQLAYMAGIDQVSPEHVLTAVDQMGRKYLLGLTPNELHTLQRLRTHGTFIPTSDADLALLMTGRVLEYPRIGQPSLFSVHPTIHKLLEQLAGGK